MAQPTKPETIGGGLLLPALLCWAAFVAVTLITWPLIPIDETRYATVAWEMWQHGEWLVPHLNGQPYAHKPPLLFWLVEVAWSMFGVGAAAARLVTVAVSIATLLLTAMLARRLWPDRPAVALLAPLVLLGTGLWVPFSTALMFDMLMALCVVAALHGLALAGGGDRRGWLLTGAAIGAGILAKGPVVLLYVIPVALFRRGWQRGESNGGRYWYLGLAAAVALGAAIALAWAIPAALHGGEAYAEAIFWRQTAGRMVESFAHARPLYWYLPLLPLVLFPWILLPGLWRGLWTVRRDRGVRLCALWAAAVIGLLSLVSGKQIHYLLPALPGVALLAARALDEAPRAASRGAWLPGLLLAGAGAAVIASGSLAPGSAPQWAGRLHTGPAWALVAIGALLLGAAWGPVRVRLTVLAMAVPAAWLAVHFVVAGRLGDYDLRGVARFISSARSRGITVAQLGDYQGQFQFLGRLTEPLATVVPGELSTWAGHNPQAYLVLDPRHPTSAQLDVAVLRQRYRDGWLLIMPAAYFAPPVGSLHMQ